MHRTSWKWTGCWLPSGSQTWVARTSMYEVFHFLFSDLPFIIKQPAIDKYHQIHSRCFHHFHPFPPFRLWIFFGKPSICRVEIYPPRQLKAAWLFQVLLGDQLPGSSRAFSICFFYQKGRNPLMEPCGFPKSETNRVELWLGSYAGDFLLGLTKFSCSEDTFFASQKAGRSFWAINISPCCWSLESWGQYWQYSKNDGCWARSLRGWRILWKCSWDGLSLEWKMVWWRKNPLNYPYFFKV